MTTIILIILALVYTIVLSLNYIIGVIRTPPGLLFLGSVHYPIDYFYYLSLFAQGQTRWLTALDLYTHEFRNAIFLGFTNVLSGRIVHALGFQPIEGYQVALAAYTLLLFLIIIKFISRYYKTFHSRRVVVFLLFATANTFQGATSFYSNAAEPLIRLARVPHKMLGLISCILPMLIYSKLQDKNTTLSTKIKLSVLLMVCGLIAANINPVQWLLVSLVLGVAILWNQIHIHGLPRPITNYRLPITKLLPVIIFFLFGLPMAIYLTHLFTIPPFSQSTAWEGSQYVKLSIESFILSFGPIVLLGIIGLPITMKKMTFEKMCMVLYFLFSILLFLSPLSRIVHATNTRFLSALTILAASLFATDFISSLPIGNRVARTTVMWVIVGILVIYQTPVFISQFWRNANLATNNAYIYMHTDAYQAMMEVKKITTDSDTVLVTWPYDRSFPGITGRRGYMGNPDQTINPEIKNNLAYDFFDARVSEEAMYKFLIDNRITYVVGFRSTEKIKKSFMIPVYENTLISVYKVRGL